MSKKIIISEEEKKQIKNLYNLQEQAFVDSVIQDLMGSFFNKKKDNSSSYDDENDKEIEHSDSNKGEVKLVGDFDSTQKTNIKLMIDYMNRKGITDPLTQIGILSVISKESGFKPKSEVSYSTT